MSCREDRPVGDERKEAVQIRLSRGLARHSMTGLHAAGSLPAHFFVTVFSNSSPVTRQPRFHYPVLGFPIWHIFIPGVVLVLPDQEKSWFHNCPGNNHQSTCQELSCQFATASFPTRIRSQVSKTGLCISSVLPFRLLTWPPIDLEFNRFSLVDRSVRRRRWFSAGEAMQ